MSLVTAFLLGVIVGVNVRTLITLGMILNYR